MFLKKRILILRFISILAVVGLILSLGAFPLSINAKEKVTLEFWGMKQAQRAVRKAQREAIKDFEAKTGIDVEIRTFPYPAYREKLLTASRAGTPPDVATIDQIWTPEFAARDFILPLGDYIKESEVVQKEKFFSGAWGSNLYKEKVWGVPFDVGVWGFLYYNKEMFSKAGINPNNPPTTWTQVIDIAMKVNKDTDGDGEIDQWAIAMYAGPSEAVTCVMDAFIFSNGGSILTEDFRESTINNPATVKTIKMWKRVAATGPTGTVSRTAEDALKLFTSGITAMTIYGGWGQDTIQARAPEMEWGMARFPKLDKGHIGTFGGWNATIFRQTEHPQAAFKFIEFITERTKNEKMASLHPANKAAAKAYIRKKRRYPITLYEQLTTTRYRPIFPNYPSISKVKRTALQNIAMDKMSVEEALNQAHQEISKILNQYYGK